MKPTNCSTMISGPGVVSAMPRPSSISPGLEPVVVLDRLLRHVGQHGVGAAEGDHRHLAEEDSDLAEHVGAAERGEQRCHWDEPQRQPHRPKLARSAAPWDVHGRAIARQAGSPQRRPLFARSVTAAALKRSQHRSLPPTKPDQRRAEDDDREAAHRKRKCR